MATEQAKAVEAKDHSVESRLRALYDLQKVVSEIDKIRTLRGELPLEVQDLEDEIAGLQTRLERYQADVVELEKNVAAKKIEIEEARTKIATREEEKNNVRNNREFDALTKEIEYKNLEIELCEKNINDYTKEIKLQIGRASCRERVLRLV